MASRSTRRSIKNPDIPKIDKCPTDEESPEKKELEGGRRRSLRHSPGSSTVSPPRKTRKIKDSPNIKDDDLYVNQSNMSKLPGVESNSPSKSDVDFVDDDVDKLENAMLATPRRNKKNSSISLSSKLTCHSTALSPRNLSTKSTIAESLDTISEIDSEEISSSNIRLTHNKTNIFSDNELSIAETIGKLEGGDIVNSSLKVDSSLQSPSISVYGVSKKRSLPVSPEVLDTNGSSKESPSLSCKRKCLSPSTEIKCLTTNGKQLDEVTIVSEKSVSSDVNSSTSSQVNGKMSKNGPSTLDADLHSLPLKRRLSTSPDKESMVSETIAKKSKVEDAATSSCIANSETVLPNKLNDVVSSISNSNVVPNEGLDSVSNSELFIKDFGLTEEQCIEICSLMPLEVKDSSNIVIIEELVNRMLNESISLKSMNTPRFNKLLKQLLVKYCSSDASTAKKHKLCENAHDWSKEKKTVNLRHELELALMTLYYNTGFYRKAEETATSLYKETKKLQDKEKNVKACLCLSKAYHAMGNISTARANITTAKTEALKIYTPPDLQADLDLQSGIMQVAEEKDMETAYSYFKEAATGFLESKNRSRALKYMLLTKLLVNKPEEGEKAVKSQCHIEDIDVGVEAMLCITKAAVSSSLSEFQSARVKYEKELEEDLVVKGVLDQLYHKMLEKNLLNIISPYERLQISVVADKIGLKRDEVERRLSQMILDGEVNAQLDHRDDCLYVYQPEGADQVYKDALTSITQVEKTLSLLNRKVKQLL